MAATGGSGAASAGAASAPDLLVITDATGSMGHFLAGLREALPQFLHVASLTSAFKRVGILAYYDYSDPAVTSWSGWCNPTHPASAASLIAFAETIDCSGGGDWPEAAKTAISEALGHISGPTMVLWYTDAPPHHLAFAEDSINLKPEVQKLAEAYAAAAASAAPAAASAAAAGGATKPSPAASGSASGSKTFAITGTKAARTAAYVSSLDPVAVHESFDWFSLCGKLAAAQARVFPIINQTQWQTASFYAWLAAATDGALFQIARTDGSTIARATIHLLLALMGQPNAVDDGSLLQMRYSNPAPTGRRDEARPLPAYIPPHKGGLEAASAAAAAAATAALMGGGGGGGGVTKASPAAAGGAAGGKGKPSPAATTAASPAASGVKASPAAGKALLGVGGHGTRASPAAGTAAATASASKASPVVAVVTDENDGNGGYLPHKSLRVGVAVSRDIDLPRFPALECNLKALIGRFRDEAQADFRDVVFAAFADLLTPKTIEALTYNSVFGSFWRAICERRKDPRRDALMAQLSSCLSALSPARREPVQAWLDASYNRVAEIQATIDKVLEQKAAEIVAAAAARGDGTAAAGAAVAASAGAGTAPATSGAASIEAAVRALRYPALVCDSVETWKAQELMEISHTCSPPVIARVTKLLASLRVVQTEEHASTTMSAAVAKQAAALARAAAARKAAAAKRIGGSKATAVEADEADTAPASLPLAVPDGTLFSLLPHLLCPGTMVTLRPSVLFAALAVAAKCAPLLARAEAFLTAVRGKWLDRDAPENCTMGFLNLISKVAAIALTKEEQEHVARLRAAGGVLLAANSDLELNTRGVLSKPISLPDVKRPCKTCKHPRSFTLLLPTGECGLCASGTGDIPEPLSATKSYFADCISCGSRYAVVNKDGLRVRPKCHFCRTSGAAAPSTSSGKKAKAGAARTVVAPRVPTLSCDCCGVKYVFPRKGKAEAAARTSAAAAPTAGSDKAASPAASATGVTGIATSSPSAASAAPSSTKPAGLAAPVIVGRGAMIPSPAATAVGSFPSPAASTAAPAAPGITAEHWQCPACRVGYAPASDVHRATLLQLAGVAPNDEVVLSSLGLARAPAGSAPAAAATGVAVHPGTSDVFSGPGTTIFNVRNAVAISDLRTLAQLIPGVLTLGAGAAAAAAGAASAASGGAGTSSSAAGDAALLKPLWWKGLLVSNSSAVLGRIAECVTAGKAELGTCGLCWEDLPKDKLVAVCGRKGCETVACNGCLAGWYGVNKPGGVFVPAYAQCPFCKRVPSPKVLTKYNERMCAMMQKAGGGKGYDPAWHYGWCLGCYRPAEYMEKRCAEGGEPPALENFNCADCIEARAVAAAERAAALDATSYASRATTSFMRVCPGPCGTMIIKVGGCDHITCSGCRPATHWCWRCGKICVDGAATYRHMMHCRGDDSTAKTIWVDEDDDFFEPDADEW